MVEFRHYFFINALGQIPEIFRQFLGLLGVIPVFAVILAGFA